MGRDLVRKNKFRTTASLHKQKIMEDLREIEMIVSLINQLCVVYEFTCDLCDANYIGYISTAAAATREIHKLL